MATGPDGKDDERLIRGLEEVKVAEPSLEYGNFELSLGSLIKKHLKQHMAQKTLAARVGTSQSRISEYIRGAVVPSLGVAARICKELQIDPKSFIDACSRL